MSDYIDSLPTDDAPLNSEEVQVMNTLFKKDANLFQKFMNEIKLPLIVAVVFITLSMPQVSEFIRNTVPYAKSSETSLLAFKTLLFMVIIFIYNNCNLVMK